MMTAPLVSIVIPSRSGKVDRLEAELKKQSFKDWEIVVNTEPPNPARARNQGAAQAKGRFFFFFDDDVRLSSSELLQKVLTILENKSGLVVVGVRDGLAPDANAFQQKVFRSAFRTDEGEQREAVTEAAWHGDINGRCMAMSRETFEAIGGFDDGLISGEDFEILYRLRQMGGTAYVINDERVFYYPPANFKILMKKILWYARGNSQVARKYPESGYRYVLKSPFHAAAYLFMHTLCLLPLCFLKVSYHHRSLKLTFRPAEALLAFYGAWIYCYSWYTIPVSTKILESKSQIFDPVVQVAGVRE